LNARHAIERQWAALVVRQPAARHILLKWMRAYQIEPFWFRVEDTRAALMLRAVITLGVHNHPVNIPSVAAYLARYDFALTSEEALQFVAGLVDALPADVDAERMALAMLAAMGITFPEPEVTEYLSDPYGRRADIMQTRKVRVQR
jgi:hypothetical protein